MSSITGYAEQNLFVSKCRLVYNKPVKVFRGVYLIHISRRNAMKKLGIFMADGCEEIEGLTVVDLIRRTEDIEITMISITDKKEVTGAHKIVFWADALIREVDFDSLDGVILPGGMPGTLNLGENKTVMEVIKKFAMEGKLVAAICAAPSVLAAAGLLEGKNAAAYPSFEEKLVGANVLKEAVVVDKNIITSRGMGTAMEFGLEIISYLCGKALKERIGKGIVYLTEK